MGDYGGGGMGCWGFLAFLAIIPVLGFGAIWGMKLVEWLN